MLNKDIGRQWAISSSLDFSNYFLYISYFSYFLARKSNFKFLEKTVAIGVQRTYTEVGGGVKNVYIFLLTRKLMISFACVIGL